MTKLNVFTNNGNIEALKILVACKKCDKDVQIIPLSKFVNPSIEGYSVYLEILEGQFIFDVNCAVVGLFDNRNKENPSQIYIDELLEWEKIFFQNVSFNYLKSIFGSGKTDPTLIRTFLEDVQKKLTSKTAFGDKDNLTAADIVIWCAILPYFHKNAHSNDFRGDFPNLSQWFDTLSSFKEFSESLKELFPGNFAEVLKAYVSSRHVLDLPNFYQEKNIAHKAPNGDNLETEKRSSVITEANKQEALESWKNGRKTVPLPRKRSHPVLPQEGEKNILITSALPYVNNVPHLGNIIGCVLSADVYSRFCQLKNYNSLFVCGTDEYGTATETKAVEEKSTPQQICDKYNKLHTEVYEWFNIKFDYFGRTTTKEQTKIAQEIFWELYDNNYILKDSMEQLRCENCQKYLADRFVEGTCPFCKFEDARGDQCDKCGKLINAIELINPKCKTCSKTPVVRSTDHLFLDLPTLSVPLGEHLEKEFDKGIWTNNSKVITKAWLRDGLKPRCISRDLKWGVQVPLEGYTDKVFYVWYDAPIGYISITANYTDQWEKWWKNPDVVDLHHFMAKDNVPFHSVIFPCTLLGCKTKWTLVKHLSATEYLNYEDTKFSKSRGCGVFGNNAKETTIDSDIWRFYLLYIRPESQDSAFSWDDFITKNNSELLNNIGNFINRALNLVFNSFKGVIPDILLDESDIGLIAQINEELREYNEKMEKTCFRDGLRNILSISKFGNQYIQANKPWELFKGNEEQQKRCGTVVGLASNVACLLSVLMKPFMPNISEEIQSQLNAPSECNFISDKFIPYIESGHKINKPKPLIKQMDPNYISELRKKYSGAQVHENATAVVPTPQLNENDIRRLGIAVAEQGSLVREMKSAKADDNAIKDAVSKLLIMKKELAKAQGTDESEINKSSNSKKKNKKK